MGGARAPQTPIEQKNPNPFWRLVQKVHKSLRYRVIVGAVFLLVLCAPFLALAHPSSIAAILGAGTPADAASDAYGNSQTMPLLAAGDNIAPNAGDNGSDLPVGSDAALAPQIGPSGTAADVEEMPTSSQISVYTVRAGDTLSQIAEMFGVSVNTIIWANNIDNGVIHPGEQLVILPVTGIQHTVVAGETLASLAKKYGGNAGEIAQYNGLTAEAALSAGETIIIPNGEITPPAPAKSSSTSSKSSGSSLSKSSKPASSPSGTPKSESTTGNPYRGGSGPSLSDYYENPVPGAMLTQGLHGENAVDLAISRGTPVHAAAAGRVIVARDNGGWNGGYGNYVVISHANGTQTLYAHMTTGSITVSVGESVSRGEIIGHVGMTGDATGPHVHFEVRGATNPFAACSVGERVGEFSCE
ncbi:MAG: peptidoglycan DD-metalloendopeptidase family protein [Minisyncoccia bacterium]